MSAGARHAGSTARRRPGTPAEERHRAEPRRVPRPLRPLVALVGLLAVICACGSGEPAANVGSTSPATSSSTLPTTSVEGDDLDDADGSGTDGEAAFEFVITDVFTSEDTGRVVLVGHQATGSLHRGEEVETFTVGPASRATVLQIDRVTPSPLTRDVDELLVGEAGNIELSGGVADDYIQGQTIIPPV